MPLPPLRRTEVIVDRYSTKERDRIVERTVSKYELTASERDRLCAALTDVENAKAKEYWQKRGPAETIGVVGRVALGTGVTIAAGIATPSSVLVPSAMSSVISIGATLAVLYKRLAHALYGRAALEVSKIDEQRLAKGETVVAPKKNLRRRFADWIAMRVVGRYAARNELTSEQRAIVESSVRDAAILKETELWEKRLGVEIAAIAGSSLIGAAAGTALGLIALPGVGVLALSALFGSLITVAVSARKMLSHLEGAAYATVERLAEDAPTDSALFQNASRERAREKSALAAAEKITAKYAQRYGLDPDARMELKVMLESLAHLKEKELWEMRLLPTLIAPLTRGGSVAVAASMLGLVGPPTAAALMIGAVAESAVSGLLLYKKLEQALEGAAYAFVSAAASGRVAPGARDASPDSCA